MAVLPSVVLAPPRDTHISQLGQRNCSTDDDEDEEEPSAEEDETCIFRPTLRLMQNLVF
jgi:hypothetical protein